MERDSQIFVGLIIDHPYSRTVTHLDNLLATLGSLNTAQVHFNVVKAQGLLDNSFSERLVVGSCVLSIVTGLASAGWGSPFLKEIFLEQMRISTPLYAGDTVSARSEVLEVNEIDKKRTRVRSVTTGINQRDEVLLVVVRTFEVER